MSRGPKRAAAQSLIEELRAWVGEQLSPIAKPDEIRLTDNLPKTRSGKIMRRLLRSIARGEEITQDMSTLENPAILEQLRGGAAAAPAAKRAIPREACHRHQESRDARQNEESHFAGARQNGEENQDGSPPRQAGSTRQGGAT